jgi:uncharacterized protein YlxW (UPF0749 family)
MKITLSEQRKNECKDLIASYQECHTELTDMQKQLENLVERINIRTSELSDLRKKEQDMYSALTEEFGPGEIDSLNLEWKITEK